MKTDKVYCMSSYLMYRYIADDSYAFSEKLKPNFYRMKFDQKPITNSDELEENLKKVLENEFVEGKTALMLSGGIDSAILAKLVPKGTIAYTLKCVANNALDETKKAAIYAKENGLEHRVIEVYWEDYLNFLPQLLINKGAPIHSIEPQIYKAALVAKKDGIENLIFGESADCLFGGLSGLFSGKWTLESFVDRYSFIMPSKVLKDYLIIDDPIKRFLMDDGIVDIVKFMREIFFFESMGSYTNPIDLVGINFIAPYAHAYPKNGLDLERIRKGENKYLIREIYKKYYPNEPSNEKTPMPRPVEQWLNSWDGPKRKEFKNIDINTFSGDQKWMIFCLEYFLNLLDKGITNI